MAYQINRNNKSYVTNITLDVTSDYLGNSVLIIAKPSIDTVRDHP